MKAILGILAGLVFTASAFAQGQVAFANTASTSYRIWTNSATGGASNLISGANAFRFGLYAAQGAGQPSGSLQLVGLGTNIAAPIFNGFFSGGVPFNLPAPYAAGDTITFQIKAWSLAAGTSYAEAVAADFANPGRYMGGVSFSIGQTVLTASPAPPAPLYGTAPGLLNTGFELVPLNSIVPEPSSWALLGLAAVTAAMFCRRRRR